MRPKTLLEYVGQQHVLSQTDGALYKYIEQGIIPSMILWGPPGVGKTSLARLLTKAVTTRRKWGYSFDWCNHRESKFSIK